MKNLRVACRYAKAFLAFVHEKGIEQQAYEDMLMVYKAFQSADELKVVLKSPAVRTAKKLNIINGIFKGRVHPLSLHYLNIIARKNRTPLIEGIALEYLRIYKESLNIEVVKLITAGEINEEIKRKALEVAAKKTDKEIEFQQVTNPELIGGFILNIGDLRYDASVKSELARMKRRLLRL